MITINVNKKRSEQNERKIHFSQQEFFYTLKHTQTHTHTRKLTDRHNVHKMPHEMRRNPWITLIAAKVVGRQRKLREMEILPECVLMGFTFITFTIFIVRWRIIFLEQMRINSSSAHTLRGSTLRGFACKLFRLHYIQLPYASLPCSFNNRDETALDCCDLNLIIPIYRQSKWVDGNKSVHLLKIHLQSNNITKTNCQHMWQYCIPCRISEVYDRLTMRCFQTFN